MNFKQAFKLMKDGYKVKLPSWGGYWYWDTDNETIMMHVKDNVELDIRGTGRVEYTLSNVLSDDWVIADEENTPVLGGEALFDFSEAIKYLKRGFKLSRKGWNGKEMYLFKSPKLGCQMYEKYTNNSINDLQEFIVMKAADDTLIPWHASQTDLLSDDWVLIE